MRVKHTPKNKMDIDLLYTCDYPDFRANIRVFWDTKALFCDWHLICKDDDILFLQTIADFYNRWYSQGLDDMQEKIQEKIQDELFNS